MAAGPKVGRAVHSGGRLAADEGRDPGTGGDLWDDLVA